MEWLPLLWYPACSHIQKPTVDRNENLYFSLVSFVFVCTLFFPSRKVNQMKNQLMSMLQNECDIQRPLRMLNRIIYRVVIIRVDWRLILTHSMFSWFELNVIHGSQSSSKTRMIIASDWTCSIWFCMYFLNRIFFGLFKSLSSNFVAIQLFEVVVEYFYQSYLSVGAYCASSEHSEKTRW